MTEFKIGDRVRLAIGEHHEGPFVGKVTGVTDHEFNGQPIIDILTDSGVAFWGYVDVADLLERADTRPLVGLASTLPPRYFAPFTSEGSEVIDALGGSFFFVEGDEEGTTEIAEYVTKALNAYAGKES